MSVAAGRAGAAALVLLLSWSCSPSGRRAPERAPQPVLAPPAAAAVWPAVLAATRAAADSGAYAEADSALRTFSEQFVGTPESAESVYWRALLLLDPQNPKSSTSAAAAALDAYLAGGQAQHRFGQVTVLRRAVGLVDSLRIAATPKPPAPVQRDTLLDQELERLRAELAVAKTELERIKRRLATPRP
jgi:hypothetical protein